MVDLGPLHYRPKPADIGLTRISGAGGAAIRAAQWAAGDGFRDLEHAFEVTDWPDPDTFRIIEAMPGGAQHVYNWHDPDRTLWLICPDQYREAVVAEALAMVDTPYSFLGYGALALHRFHIPAPHLKKYIASSGHLICSQLVDRAAMRGGWKIFDDGRDPGDVTPGDLTKAAIQSGGRAGERYKVSR